ncbi:hypothetical protein EOD39_14318 [Acipenser ruthenus]|uniref:Uncharacterized protein n=1 Tax=Acipenser ruthenus TaxID=7906 RepID=A0A662YLX9_ACIRT|nr:hypothetical protein EOD39_14318 [Acipenser ruthenus]
MPVNIHYGVKKVFHLKGHHAVLFLGTATDNSPKASEQLAAWIHWGLKYPDQRCPCAIRTFDHVAKKTAQTQNSKTSSTISSVPTSNFCTFRHHFRDVQKITFIEYATKNTGIENADVTLFRKNTGIENADVTLFRKNTGIENADVTLFRKNIGKENFHDLESLQVTKKFKDHYCHLGQKKCKYNYSRK